MDRTEGKQVYRAWAGVLAGPVKNAPPKLQLLQRFSIHIRELVLELDFEIQAWRRS